jgi:hypothetical protein
MQRHAATKSALANVVTPWFSWFAPPRRCVSPPVSIESVDVDVSHNGCGSALRALLCSKYALRVGNVSDVSSIATQQHASITNLALSCTSRDSMLAHWLLLAQLELDAKREFDAKGAPNSTLAASFTSR